MNIKLQFLLIFKIDIAWLIDVTTIKSEIMTQSKVKL